MILLCINEINSARNTPKDGLEIMTRDWGVSASTVTVLDVNSPQVQEMLKAAGCDLNEVNLYNSYLKTATGQPPPPLPQPQLQQLQQPPQSQPQQQQQQQQQKQQQQQSLIESHVEEPYKSLPFCFIDTVRTVEPPALLHCHLWAYGMSPDIPAKAHIAVCSSCFRRVSRKDTINPEKLSFDIIKNIKEVYNDENDVKHDKLRRIKFRKNDFNYIFAII